MLNLKKSLDDMQSIAKSTQSFAAAIPAAGSQSAHFWKAQDTVLKECEAFSEAWFKRRHEATQSALDASKKLAERSMGDPMAAMSILAEWQSHSMERLAADARDYLAMMTGCAAAVISNEVESMDETVASAKRATKSAKSEPV